MHPFPSSAPALRLACAFFVALFLLVACTNRHGMGTQAGPPLVLDGDPQQTAILFQVPKASPENREVYLPLMKLQGGIAVHVPEGKYYVANDCFGHSFEHRGETHIPLGKISLETFGISGLSPVECRDPIDGHLQTWTDRLQFEAFPGSHTLTIGSRQIEFRFNDQNPAVQNLELLPVRIAGLTGLPSVRYFASAAGGQIGPGGQQAVVSALSGDQLLLPKGEYNLEVNGTRVLINLEKKPLEFQLGSLQIAYPSGFKKEERIQLGGQPIFFYVNEGVLFNLDTEYQVFPGQYSISLEGSELKENVVVEAGKKTSIRTQAVRIDPPPCDQDRCKQPPVVTLHRDQKIYTLMQVVSRIPFLLFEGKYEFGVEGLRGILHMMPQTKDESLKSYTLGRLRLNWETKPATTRFRTDMIRLEARDSPLFGKSMDLTFGRPTEVLVPPGNYWLSHWLGDSAGERQRQRQELTIRPGSTVNLTLTVISEKNAETHKTPVTAVEPREEELPTSLAPVLR